MQVQDGVSLNRGEGALQVRLLGLDTLQVDIDGLIAEVRDQILARFAAILATTNDRNHRIEVIKRNLVALKDVLAFASPRQQVDGAAAYHIDAMINEVLDGLHQAHFLRLAVGHSQEDHAERFLH